MKILVINGVNLNMLGVREPQIYGNKTYKALCTYIKAYAKQKGVKVSFFQSNCEGDLVTAIQKAYQKFDGIVINPGQVLMSILSCGLGEIVWVQYSMTLSNGNIS